MARPPYRGRKIFPFPCLTVPGSSVILLENNDVLQYATTFGIIESLLRRRGCRQLLLLCTVLCGMALKAQACL